MLLQVKMEAVVFTTFVIKNWKNESLRPFFQSLLSVAHSPSYVEKGGTILTTLKVRETKIGKYSLFCFTFYKNIFGFLSRFVCVYLKRWQKNAKMTPKQIWRWFRI